MVLTTFGCPVLSQLSWLILMNNYYFSPEAYLTWFCPITFFRETGHYIRSTAKKKQNNGLVMSLLQNARHKKPTTIMW